MTDDKVYLVYDHCDCEDPGCYGRIGLAVFLSKQTALQEAELRSRRYGGSAGRPEMHMETVKISRKVSGF